MSPSSILFNVVRMTSGFQLHKPPPLFSLKTSLLRSPSDSSCSEYAIILSKIFRALACCTKRVLDISNLLSPYVINTFFMSDYFLLAKISIRNIVSIVYLLILAIVAIMAAMLLTYLCFQLSTPLVLLEKLMPSLTTVRLSIAKGAA